MADRAILFGINDYRSIGDLNGCVNDVANIHRLLSKQFGFDAQNIHQFFDDQVTRKRITEEFAWLVKGAVAGDRLVFHFSGHGSYIPSEDKDEDVDEVLCLYDMDWSDPESYLLDDDLGDLTSTAPPGVHLTVILDCCHSGTGTRAITSSLNSARSVTPKTRLMVAADTANQVSGGGVDFAGRLEKGEAVAMRSMRQAETPPVLARFVHPPAKLQVKKIEKARHIGARAQRELNHQLLAGAADSQTAADAFIQEAYHGAFSYYFCFSARKLGVSATFDEVMKEAVANIKSNGYGQTPQNEGPFGSVPLFGGDAKEPPTPMPPVDPVDAACAEASLVDRAVANQAGPLELLGDLLRVSEKLIDLAAGVPGAAIVEPTDRAAAHECVVYVHGISQHRPGYSAAWFSAMQPHLTRPVQRREVVWSHHVNARTVERAEEKAERRDFIEALEAELEDRISHVESQIAASGASARMIRERSFLLDDFTRYMFNRETREAILGEFDAVVRPLLQSGKKLHIVGHSWGTVVAYEGLRRMDNEGHSGSVANLFTAGSALSIGPVQSNLFGRVGDGRRPSHVHRIVNLDAGGDIVGGPIGDAFTVSREFLGLAPVGCATIPFTNIAFNPVCSHSSYFRPANTEVNDQIFARFINHS